MDRQKRQLPGDIEVLAKSGNGDRNGNGAVRKSRTLRGKNGETTIVSINFGPLATWVGFNLRMAQESSFQTFSRLSAEVGESPGRFATLTLISRNPGISQTDLSQAAGRDKSSLTPVVEDLVRRGLVERQRLTHDRRAYCLNVTREGKKTLAVMTRCARRHERYLDKIIGKRDRKRFIQILKKLAAGPE